MKTVKTGISGNFSTKSKLFPSKLYFHHNQSITPFPKYFLQNSLPSQKKAIPLPPLLKKANGL